MRDWDLVVIGGGTAGLVASRTAARLGASVLLVERERLGGDCLWTGCIPSKALVSAADRGADAVAAKESVERSIAGIEPVDSREALEADGVAVLEGQATFLGPRSLAVDGETHRFRHAIIATGARPRTLRLDGAGAVRLLTTEDFWDLDPLPTRLLVLGGGPAGCEIAQAMARLGAAVTLVHRGDQLLPAEEADAAALILRSLRADGVDLRLGATVQRFRASAEGARAPSLAILDDGEEIEVEAMLATIGRIPRTDGLALHLAGVRTTAEGHIEVDRTLRTAAPSIWAAGDVTGHPMFTHSAGVDASVAAMNAVLGLGRRRDPVVPRVTYTSPEVGAVGLQAADADPAAHHVVTHNHSHADRAITDGLTGGYTRIVVDRRGRILGGTVVSPRAGETLGELSLAVRQGLTTGDLAGTIHPYPTYSDGLWNTAIEDLYRRLGRGGTGRAIGALRRVRTWREHLPRRSGDDARRTP